MGCAYVFEDLEKLCPELFVQLVKVDLDAVVVYHWLLDLRAVWVLVDVHGIRIRTRQVCHR